MSLHENVSANLKLDEKTENDLPKWKLREETLTGDETREDLENLGHTIRNQHAGSTGNTEKFQHGTRTSVHETVWYVIGCSRQDPERFKDENAVGICDTSIHSKISGLSHTAGTTRMAKEDRRG